MSKPIPKTSEHRLLLCSAVLSLLPVLLLTLFAAWVASRTFELSQLYVLKTSVVLAAGTLLILRGLPHHHPFPRFGMANRITLIRGAIAALLAGLVAENLDLPLPGLLTGLVIIAAILDGLDGLAARRTQMASAFGARFDMETDALIILLMSILVWQSGKLGAWVLLSGLMRYAYVLAGALIPRLQQALAPSYRRKTIAAVQLVALIIAFAPFTSSAVATAVASIALLALSYSFAADIVWQLRNPLPKPQS